MELLAKLGIDWRLLVAQAVNFALLLGVLTFFVYKPLLSLIDARRARIAKSLEDAEKIEHQKKELDAYRAEQMRKIDEETGKALEHARGQAEALKQEIISVAQHEAEQLLVRGRSQLSQERATVFRDVQGSLTRIILTLTEKMLRREFSPADQEKLLASLEKDLPALLR